MVILKRESGGHLPKPQGHHAAGKLARCNGWLQDRLAIKGELTLDAIVGEMSTVHGVSAHRGSAHRGSVGTWLHRLGLSHKKNAAGQRNPAARHGRTAQGSGRNAPVRHG